MRTAADFRITAREILLVEEAPTTITVPPWPELPQEAYYGLAGEIVTTIEPRSEADSVALLMHLLVDFGNMVGRGPYFSVGGTTHHTNLNCVHVGGTASRKGTAKDDITFVIRPVDPDWCNSRVQSGLSSGEGLIWAVRDQIEEQHAIRATAAQTGFRGCSRS